MTGSSARRLVGPHAEAEEAEAELLADRLDLVEMAAGLGAGLVEMLARRAGQLELAGRLEADRAVRAGQGDDVAALHRPAPSRIRSARRAGRGCRRARHRRARDDRRSGRRTSHARCRSARRPPASRRARTAASRSSRLSIGGRPARGFGPGRHRRASSGGREAPPAGFDAPP